MAYYLLEVDQCGTMSPDVAIVAELLKQKAWRNREEKADKYFRLLSWEDIELFARRSTAEQTKSQVSDPRIRQIIEELIIDIPEEGWPACAIPVGSVDFCNAILGEEICPLNVPLCLREESYVCRRIADVTADDIPGYFRKWHTDKLFIKSATVAKDACTGLYGRKEPLPLFQDDLYQISEPLDFKAEWRVFVYKGNIQAIRQYSGRYDELLTQSDIQYVKSVLTTIEAGISPKLKAYTLDIGRTSARDIPVVVEVQNFVACGLYGFEDFVILNMLNAGIERERDSRNS